MTPPEYRCPISQASLEALEALASASWTGVAMAAQATRPAGQLIVLTSEMRVTALRPVSIGAVSVDIAPKSEVFRLEARFVSAEATHDPRFKDRVYVDAGEIVDAFLGHCNRLFIAGRRLSVPRSVSSTVGGLLVEDLLVIRDLSGQQAFVAASDEQPTTLVIARRWEDVPNNDAEISYLRAL
jgi:hypothetical protein